MNCTCLVWQRLSASISSATQAAAGYVCATSLGRGEGGVGAPAWAAPAPAPGSARSEPSGPPRPEGGPRRRRWGTPRTCAARTAVGSHRACLAKTARELLADTGKMSPTSPWLSCTTARKPRRACTHPMVTPNRSRRNYIQTVHSEKSMRFVAPSFSC